MNMAMILGLFPGFMSMIAVYFILKAIGLTEGNLIKLALILVYSGGAALGFQIAKGFFDTVPFAVDEAALLDGCFHVPVAGLHLRKGYLPRELRPVHDRDRTVEDAGKRVH